MLSSNRRYDIDWVRVIAIGLLLIYHVAVAFQPWGIMIGFVTTEKPWLSLWIPMTMLNVWRIPLLFFVSGMGVCFAMQNRTWKQLMGERTARIMIPYVIGVVLIVPMHVYLWQSYYHWKTTYAPNPGHLWFLGNILSYVVFLSPIFYLFKRNENKNIIIRMKKIFSTPIGMLLIVSGAVAEAVFVDPHPYEMYAMTWHGFFLGLQAFFFGFWMVFSGDDFWKMILKWRWMMLAVAVILFCYRVQQSPTPVDNYQLAIESVCWILTVFGFGYRYLNRESGALRYWSEAAYPVYILHMIFLTLASMLVFRLKIALPTQFVLVVVITATSCMIVYEFIVRRVNFIRVLFGLKRLDKEKKVVGTVRA